jgi:hypothetical protein
MHWAIISLRFQRITTLPTKLAVDGKLGIGIKIMEIFRKITINKTGDNVESINGVWIEKTA